MIDFTSDRFGWSVDETGTKLTVYTPQARQIAESVENGKDHVITIKKKAESRSLNANNYLWALLTKCAEKLGTSKEELYIDYVRKYGIFKDFKLSEEEARTFQIAWSKMGTGWPTERLDFDGDDVVVRAYYGSSTYNTRQMSRLISMVVEDAKEAGIDVMSEQERSLLLDNWEPVKV